MTKEIKTLEITAYRDQWGNPCCAGDFPSGEVCTFYRTKKFGTYETCVFGATEMGNMKVLARRGDGEGTLIPLFNCPLWHKENLEKACAPSTLL